MDADTPDLGVAARCRTFYVRGGLYITTTTDGMLLIILDVQTDAHAAERISQTGNRTVAATAELELLAVDANDTLKHTLEVSRVLRLARRGGSGRGGAVGGNVVVDNGEARIRLEEVLLLKEVGDFVGEKLAAVFFGLLLDLVGKDNLQATRQVEVEMAQDDPGGATLARLRVDADDSLVGAADILGVEGQIGDLPVVLVGLVCGLAGLETLLDGILVGATEGTHDQGATIRSALVYRDLVANLYSVDDTLEVRKVNVGVDALGIEIQTESDEVDVTGALAVAKEAAFDSVRASHLCQLGGSHCAAAIVVRMKRHADGLAVRDVGAKVLDLVGVDIGRGHFYRGGQVEDDGVLNGGLPGGLDGLADLDHELGARVRKGLGAKLKRPLGGGLCWVVLGQGADELGATGGELEGLLLGEVEDDAAEALAGGEVDVNNGLFRAAEGLDGAADQILAARGENLQPDIIGHCAGCLDEAAGKVKVDLRSRGEGNLNLLVSDVDEHFEVAPFLVAILKEKRRRKETESISDSSPAEVLVCLPAGIYHGVDQALVSIAQIGREPARRLVNGLGRPLPVWKVERLKPLVLGRGVFEPAFARKVVMLVTGS